MNIELNSKKLFMFFISIIVFLVIANGFAIISEHFLSYSHMETIIRLFNVDREMNIPTLYSSCAMIFASLLLGLIAYVHLQKNEKYLAWAGLSGIFLFLALDEMTELHEMLVGPVRSSLNTTGILYFAWVIPYAVLLVIFALIYFKFLFRLPSTTRNRLILAGVIYVSGALVMELIGGKIAEQHGTDALVYAISYSIEETLEMLGIAVLIYTATTYISEQFPKLSIQIKD
ncbi:hypothetical protein [Aliivibrio fischeri]|uniref:hypothetical protein n=1 Tax=Aliivibrio fischeri TaxID=668 RepID=UPI0002F095B6|nr:hypothetical protein [Aliivibrio fischeri]